MFTQYTKLRKLFKIGSELHIKKYNSLPFKKHEQF